jgi:predicted Holliday junction resolvase-like endonuclease
MKEAKQIIDSLSSGKFYSLCPCGCGEEINLGKASLFYLNEMNQEGKAARQALLDDLKEQRIDLKERAVRMQTKPKVTAKAVNIGFILERIAPGFNHFPFEHNDCRSLFDPIDYVIFDGLKENGIVSRIIFTDIKTGGAKLNPHQKEIKLLVQEKKVEFQVY